MLLNGLMHRDGHLPGISRYSRPWHESLLGHDPFVFPVESIQLQITATKNDSDIGLRQ